MTNAAVLAMDVEFGLKPVVIITHEAKHAAADRVITVSRKIYASHYSILPWLSRGHLAFLHPQNSKPLICFTPTTRALMRLMA